MRTETADKARSLLGRGREAMSSGDYSRAAELFLEASETDPGLLEAHEQYIRAAPLPLALDPKTGRVKNDPETEEQVKRLQAEIARRYEGLAKEHPADPVFAWALGKTQKDYSRAEEHYLRSLELDPEFARSYGELALIAQFRGENDRHVEYLRKASELNPDDPAAAFYHADSVREDHEKRRRLLTQVAERFPEDERGAQALYWLAMRDPDAEFRIDTLERLRRDFPMDKFHWSASGVTALLSIHVQEDLGKALALADEVSSTDESGRFGAYTDAVRRVKQAEELVSAEKSDQAVDLLEKVELHPGARLFVDIALARANAAAGEVDRAYTDVIQGYADTSQQELLSLAQDFGKTLGKSAQDVIADVWQVRYRNAQPAPDFSLGIYGADQTVSLSDLRGKVVLVNFWYPACGPCRGEFPYLKALVESLEGQPFEVLAINGVPEQDEFVLPFMEGNGYPWTALRGTKEVLEAYGVWGFPHNALIDAEGVLVLRPSLRNEQQQEALERTIRELMER